MTSQGLSRAVRLFPQSRCWLNRSRCTPTIPHQTSTVLPQLCWHRCSSSETPSKTPSSTKGGVGDDDDVPISYTSSKALNWPVHNSYGRHKKRPWYKVAPISIGLTIFMAWVFFRKETEIDRQLEVHLHERLPGLFPEPVKTETATPTASLQEDPDDTTKEEE